LPAGPSCRVWGLWVSSFSQRAPVRSDGDPLLRSPRYFRAAYTTEPSYHRLGRVPDKARGTNGQFPALFPFCIPAQLLDEILQKLEGALVNIRIMFPLSSFVTGLKRVLITIF
jgi:hypothetical protein